VAALEWSGQMGFDSDGDARSPISGYKSTRILSGQVLTDPERRRRWSYEEKLRLLAEA
jgi:hypothetical protein